MIFDQRKFSDVLHALNEFPIASIQDYGAIEAIFEMRIALQKIYALVEIYANNDDANDIAQKMIDDRYPFECCKDIAVNATNHLQVALDGAGIQ